MRRSVQMVIVFLISVLAVPLAEAINITRAEVVNNLAVVEGNRAAKKATITWEGSNVTVSTNGGAFSFSSTNVPSDCTGSLSDGTTTINVGLDNCLDVEEPPASVGVLATGQTTCYDSTDNNNPITCPGIPAGQDGELQKGIARSSTDNLNGTVTDNVTGLMWEVLHELGECHVLPQNERSASCVNNVYTWTEAFQKIDILNAAQFGGYDDWRLPNINELQSIVDYGRSIPSIDPIFGPTSASGYWSSTTVVSNPDVAWGVFFNFGNVGNSFRKTFSSFVRAVRGGS